MSGRNFTTLVVGGIGCLLFVVTLHLGARSFAQSFSDDPGLEGLQEITVNPLMRSPLKDQQVRHAASIDFPAVGVVLLARKEARSDGVPAGKFVPACTATLIAPNAVLTAAHCVCGTSPNLGDAQSCKSERDKHYWAPESYRMFFQHAGISRVGRIEIYPGYNGLEGDLAVFQLSAPVTSIRPAVIGLRVTEHTLIVGFGQNVFDALHEPEAPPKGLKFHALAQPISCPTNLFPIEAATAQASICTEWKEMPEQQGMQGTICHADSGGPMFNFVQGAAPTSQDFALVGVASRGAGGTKCEFGQVSYHAKAFEKRYLDWIKKAAGLNDPVLFAAESDKLWEPVFNRDVAFLSSVSAGRRSFKGSFESSADDTLAEKVEVPSGVGGMRVSVNGTPAPSPLTLVVVDPGGGKRCEVSAGDVLSFAICDLIVSPERGAWKVLVKGSPGQKIQTLVARIPAPD